MNSHEPDDLDSHEPGDLGNHEPELINQDCINNYSAQSSAVRTITQYQLFISALMFYSRIPVPKNAIHSEDILNRSRTYFPAIGLCIGLIATLTFMLASLVFDHNLSVALSMVITILATGGFHEDGLADSCDGLGGGWSIEQVLTIMKDSRVGTYATLGLISILSLKFLSLVPLSQTNSLLTFSLVYISGHTLSRQLSSLVIERYHYVQDIDLSKVKPITDKHLSKRDLGISLFITLLPLLALASQVWLATLIASLVAAGSASLFMRYCNSRIGGYTGDILGATQQISELVFYLTMLATLNY